MDGKELIQVNLQLPASALDSLSRLTEQLRRLTEAAGRLGKSGGAPEEAVESGFFDPERFQALRQKSEEAVAGHSPQVEEAQPVRADALTPVPDPESAGLDANGKVEAPDRENSSSRDETGNRESDIREGTAAQETADEEIPTVRPDMDGRTPDAPVVQMEPDSQIPEAEKAWARPEESDLPVSAVQAEVSMGAESPLGAGMVVTAQPEPPDSRWSGLSEELETAGPAPLTAEAVSLAFQRDGRRYDNGFPLY